MEPIDEIRRKLSSIADPVALLEGLFAFAPVGFQVYRADGHSLLTNAAFRELFGAEPPPDYNILRDEIAAERGVLPFIHRAFAGETVHLPAIWYDPRELTQVSVREGRRVAIASTIFPIFDRAGGVSHVAIAFKDLTAEIEAREQAERERHSAETERELYRALIAHSGDGVIACDEYGTISVFNPEAERQHGVSAKPVSAPQWAQTYGLLAADGTPLSLDQTPLYRALQGEKVENARWQVRRPDGSVRTLVGTARPIRDLQGSARGAVLICRDETERLRLEAERHEAEARKDQFIAMLGHELRNPLAAIVAALDSASRSERSREFEVIERQARHLARLVEDLVDVSRISSGKVVLRRTVCEIGPIVHRAVQMVRPLLEQRGHACREQAAPGLWVDADPERLLQVLVNLLNNAAKYTARGGSIAVQAAREGEEVGVHVRDNGIGIAPELLEQLFEPFVQGERTLERSHGGLGLGLAIVRRLVEQHGGRVAARSAGAGSGSEFSVFLPAAAPPQEQAPAPGAGPPAATAGARLLVVDDNRDAAELIAHLLAGLGYQAHVALDGPAALVLANEVRPQVALIDLGLPGMNGFQLAEALGRQPQLRKMKLIALTGYGQERDRQATRRAGFQAHLVKPVDLPALTAAIEDALADAR